MLYMIWLYLIFTLYLRTYVYIYISTAVQEVHSTSSRFSFQVLAAVILVTFFFASAMNPGIIPRNESIPQEPPMGTAGTAGTSWEKERRKKNRMTVESNGRMKNDIRKL